MKTKSGNNSINKIKKLGDNKGLLYKQPCQEPGLCCFSFPRHPNLLSFVRRRHVCASEERKHGGRKVTETTAMRFAFETKNYYSRTPTY